MLLAAEYELLAPELLWPPWGIPCGRSIVAESSISGRLVGFSATSHGCRSSSTRPGYWADAASDLAVRHRVTVHDGLYLVMLLRHILGEDSESADHVGARPKRRDMLLESHAGRR
jgi:hypothetical protein